jgi:GT2 family glycosyltransferase
MLLSVVVVSWNVRQLLLACLASLEAELAAVAPGAAEVFVVDNASTDGSAAAVRERFPAVRLLENAANAGFAGANNQALRLCRGRFVLLLNPDTEIRPGALATLLAFLEAHPQAGAAGARLLNPDGTLQLSGYRAPTLKTELFRLFHLDAIWPQGDYPMAQWPLDEARQVDCLLGACILLRREVLEQVGLMDEKYFMYSEETDLCYRIQRAGWQIWWVPQALVVHFGGQSTAQAAGPMFLQLYWGKLRFFRKHSGRLVAPAYKLLLVVAAVSRLLLTPLVVFQKPERRARSLALAGNYVRLLRRLPSM